MSTPRFAPITAALLARKGQVFPSPFAAPLERVTSMRRPPENREEGIAKDTNISAGGLAALAPPLLAPRLNGTVANDAAEQDKQAAEQETQIAAVRRIVLSLSPREHEKLGIAAVKEGVPRNQLVRAALDSYLDRLLQTYGASCSCLGARPDQNSCCTNI